MTNEYGIACLLNQSTSDKLRQSIKFLDKGNIPHISLFQFKSNDPVFLLRIKEFVANLFISSTFETDRISLVENNVFLDIRDDSTLTSAANQISDFYSVQCQNKEYLSQINFLELDHLQQELVKLYGIYWVKKNYRPHVTLAYDFPLKGNFDITVPKNVEVYLPSIYKIDQFGRILNLA